MPNTLYKYSPSVGMMRRKIGDLQNPEEWSDSETQAMITHYLCELAIAYNELQTLSQRYTETEKRIADLDAEFGHLKTQYPEEFI